MGSDSKVAERETSSERAGGSIAPIERAWGATGRPETRGAAARLRAKGVDIWN
jgi:hypothetical protein